MTTGKTIALTRWTFVGKALSLLFNMVSGFIIAFLPRSKCLSISWLESPSAVILEPKKIKSVIVSPSICHEVMGLDAMVFVFWMLSFKPPFPFPLSSSSGGSLIPLHILPSGWNHLHVWGYWYFSWKSWFQLVLHPAWHFYVLCIEVKEAGWQYTALMYSFPCLEPVPCPVLTVASYRFLCMLLHMDFSWGR